MELNNQEFTNAAERYFGSHKTISATDSAIVSMHRFLKSKVETGSKLTGAAGELCSLTNQDSLSYFEVMFQADLERLGLI